MAHDEQAVEQKPKSWIARLNNIIANRTAVILSSMWLFWILLVAIIASYIMQPPKGAFDISLFFISTAFQGLALPVLAFVSNIQGDRQQAQLDHMQKEIHKELKLIKELIGEQQNDLTKLEDAEGIDPEALTTKAHTAPILDHRQLG